MNEKIQKLIETIQEAKMMKREAEFELCHIIETFDGTLNDALMIGLVRLNFSAPPGFKRSLRSSKRRTN
jgi:hypothetical protein